MSHVLSQGSYTLFFLCGYKQLFTDGNRDISRAGLIAGPRKCSMKKSIRLDKAALE